MQATQEALEERKAEEEADHEAQQGEARELVEKAMALGGTEEAVEVYDEVISRFQEETETETQEQVAIALVK